MVSSPTTQALRLDKYLASVTDYSRSQVKRLIKAGEVRVEGELAHDPGQLVSPTAAVELAGQRLRKAVHRYFMLYKPVDYVCANRDRQHMTVMDLMDEDNVEQLHIAGRLDIDTTGLVLITDDGQWAHQVTSPRRECWKRYRVETLKPLDESLIQIFAKGIFLASEKKRCKPGRLRLLGDCEALLEISEGKFHQVKRMFASVDNEVVALHREAVGVIELDDALCEGEYRELTAAEVESVW